MPSTSNLRSMDAPRLNLRAESTADLLKQLEEIDITVPLHDEGRTASHRERYMAARLLSTLAQTDLISYPLCLEHREKPDFALFLLDRAIGIECVEATHTEWAQIQAIRETDFPDKLIFLPMLKAGETTFSTDERVQIARGDSAGPPWVGSMAERQWADAIAHFIARKTEKLRKGNYSEFAENWLLIQDEWPVPLYRPEERMEAAKMCLANIHPQFQPPCFSHIFVGNSSWLLHIQAHGVEMNPMRDLWR